MSTLRSSTKSDSGNPYVYYTVTAEDYGRKEDSVKVKITIKSHLQYSESWLGTGAGLKGQVYIGGLWRSITIKKTSSSWSGTGSHSASDTFTVDGLTAMQTSLTGIKFRVVRTDSVGSSGKLSSRTCNSLSIPKGNAAYSSAKLTATASTQAAAKATLSGLTSAVGYTRVVCWYRGSALVGTTTISGSSKTTSISRNFTGLYPNTTYTLKAVIREKSSSGTVISTKTVSVTTAQETGELSVTAGATYITLSLSGMYDSPNYERILDVWYKKNSEPDSEYKLFTRRGNSSASETMTITGLISNELYDIKATIKNGDTTLRLLTAAIRTSEDSNLVPRAFITDITQQLGSRVCVIRWITDKDVAGTVYTIQANTGSEWKTVATVTNILSPIAVTSPEGNTDVTFRISSKNNNVASGTENLSNEVSLYVRDDFVWDSDKVAGAAVVITANEWNRLRDYALAKAAAVGLSLNVPKVAAEDRITARAYNSMKAAISAVNPVGIADKSEGDVIYAADIDALRIAVNKT